MVFTPERNARTRRPASSRNPRGNRGFTLTEMLVVLTIIAALAAIVIPVGLGIRQKSQRSACLSNLRQIGSAMELWFQDNGPMMPEWQAARLSRTGTEPVLETGLEPYLGKSDVFRCPADPKEHARSGCSYMWNTSQNGRHRNSLVFFGQTGENQRIPLISDKEGWHSGEPAVNFLYADMSAATKVRFGVSE